MKKIAKQLTDLVGNTPLMELFFCYRFFITYWVLIYTLLSK